MHWKSPYLYFMVVFSGLVYLNPFFAIPASAFAALLWLNMHQLKVKVQVENEMVGRLLALEKKVDGMQVNAQIPRQNRGWKP